jgi:transcriptional regulator with GAF, ATPase, and Fis domain
VLISGENGTGKEVVAKLIHASSARSLRPFQVVNCPALPGTLVEAELFGVEKGTATGVLPRIGRLEQASGGTLLLDEVGDLEPKAQAKLLRFLEGRTIERVGGRRSIPVDVRILAATNRDLEAAVAGGAFRQDLYFRLNAFEIQIPPLRSRSGDIPLLVEHFLDQMEGPRKSVAKDALEVLCGYAFPGNVRQLKHIIERASMLAEGPLLDVEHLPAQLLAAARPGMPPTVPAPGVDHAEREAPGRVGAMEPSRRVSGDGKSEEWKALRQRFLRRELSREQLQSRIAALHRECGRSYKRVAERLGAADEYKPFLDFLRYHRLRVND